MITKIKVAVVGLLTTMGVFAHETWREPSTGIEWNYYTAEDDNGVLSAVIGTEQGDPAIPKSTYGAIVIPSRINGLSVTRIEWLAFGDCNGLTSVTIPDCVTSIGDSAFSFCEGLTSVTIGKGVRNIGDEAFRGCAFTSVTIPSGVEIIGKVAFSQCERLTTVTVLGGEIGSSAFNGCESLTSVSIGEDVACVGEGAFCCNNALKTVSIAGGGIWKDAFSECHNLTSLTLGEGVTSIGESAFSYCESLTSLTIPKSVRSIAESAFHECVGLKKVVAQGGDIGTEAFAGCTNMTSLTLGDGVTGIGNGAFWGCEALTSISIPKTVTRIGEEAFHDCKGLKNVTVLGGEISSDTFYGCDALTSVTFGGDVKTIGDSAFSSLANLTSVTIGGSVETIGKEAFEQSEKLTSITIPEGVKTIGERAFAECHALSKATVLGGEVGRGAFGGCAKLTSVTLGKKVSGIGEDAFSGCTGLTSIVIPSGVQRIGDFAFSGCDGLTSITIPSSVECIGSWAFEDCTALTSIAIPSGVKSIEDYAFSGCTGLTSMVIPSGVELIGEWVYLGCTGLTSIAIPSSVESIGWGAFKNCDKLKTVYVDKGDEDRVRDLLVKSQLDTSNIVFSYSKGGAVPDGDVTIESELLDAGELMVGVSGTVGGSPIRISAGSGVKSVSAKGLPAGMKLVQDKSTKEWLITGAATKTGKSSVVLTVTTVSGKKVEKGYELIVSALPLSVVGTFSGFVNDSSDNRAGTIQVTTTDAGKITAKVINARGTFSFSGSAWDSIEDGVCSVLLKSKKGDELSLSVDTTLGWSGHQMTGAFGEAGRTGNRISAQRNAFGKQWYFSASGNQTSGWTFLYGSEPKTADLIVTLNADGKTSIAGKLGTIKVSSTGMCDVSALFDGAMIADFAPIVSVGKEKKVLSIRTNLWFDRTNDHDEIGTASLTD